MEAFTPPCPLGEDRNRFLRLVADIKTGKDDYAAQLSSLTLAGMTTAPAREQESERSIVRSLSGTEELPAETRRQQVAEKIWQARLVLAIAELLDQEEEEIALNMAVLEDEEKVLFKELQGEDEIEDEENPFAELAARRESMHGNAASIKNRFKAWRTFFLAGEIEECEMFLAGDKESGDILLEMYQQKTGHQAPLIAGLQLPGFIGWNSSEASTIVRKFISKNGTSLAAIEELFKDLSGQAATPGQRLELTDPQLALADAWEKLLVADFPVEQFGRISVSFHLLPGLPCATLVGKTSHSQSPVTNGLLAVIG